MTKATATRIQLPHSQDILMIASRLVLTDLIFSSFDVTKSVSVSICRVSFLMISLDASSCCLNCLLISSSVSVYFAALSSLRERISLCSWSSIESIRRSSSLSTFSPSADCDWVIESSGKHWKSEYFQRERCEFSHYSGIAVSC